LAGESVVALSAKDGKKLWSAAIGKVGNPEQQPSFPGARSTPSVDGDAVYALSSDGDLASLDINTGRERWRKSFRRDFGGTPGQWAYAESPLIDGDTLICTPGGAGATIVALNKKTGELIWKCAVPGQTEAGYASAVVTEIAGVRQYVQFLPKGVVGVEAKSGKLLWRYERSSKNSPAPIVTPLVDNGYVYTGAYQAGGGLIHLVKKGENFEAEEVYFSPKMPFGNGSVIKAGDNFFGGIGTALACLDFKTGEIKWEERAPGPSAFVLAEGLVYGHCESGEVVMFEPSAEGYREKGRFNPPGLPSRGDGMEKAWTHPVLANGKLYIRDKESLWCYDVAARR
jgi:outer membrane protein assembly factor BamB